MEKLQIIKTHLWFLCLIPQTISYSNNHIKVLYSIVLCIRKTSSCPRGRDCGGVVYTRILQSLCQDPECLLKLMARHH